MNAIPEALLPGVALMAVLGLLLLQPLLRLCRMHSLASPAELLAFRYQSPWTGTAFTLVLCASMLSLLALLLGKGPWPPRLAFLSFSATLQFSPGIIAIAFWPRATRSGLLAGLFAGSGLWLAMLLLPLLSPHGTGPSDKDGIDWTLRCLLTLAANSSLFLLFSLLTNPSPEEAAAAELCAPDSRSRSRQRPPASGRAGDFALLERRLEATGGHFTGLAADVDYLRRHYRQTLEELPVGLCSLGVDGEVLLWNRSLVALTGIAAVDAVGSPWRALPAPWQGVFAAALEAPPDTLLKRPLTLHGAASRWITLHCSAATADDERHVLVEDITDFQHLQDEVLHNERLASIGRLAAGVAHEIGNPLTGIACLAQNLAHTEDPAEVRDAAEAILKQTSRVSRIVESLVNFSHLGSGPGTGRLESCKLADCIDEAAQLLALDRDARTVSFDNRSPRDTLVLADSQRLLQVFINLLGNARDASSDGATVQISAREVDERVHIWIDDRGHGIPAETLSRVFEPFFTTKDVGKGTGLGLPLVYSIVEEMGGSIRIASPGPGDHASGTRVSLELAKARAPASSAAATGTRRASAGG
jgi:signal transduction histidine kinase